MAPLVGTSFYIDIYREIYFKLIFSWTSTTNTKEFICGILGTEYANFAQKN